MNMDMPRAVHSKTGFHTGWHVFRPLWSNSWRLQMKSLSSSPKRKLASSVNLCNSLRERVSSLLDYNPLTGEFHYKVYRAGYGAKARPGAIANSTRSTGYIMITIDGKSYSAAKLAWLLVYGEWPGELDHINRVRNDNRIVNLRKATRQQNSGNHGLSKNSTTGVKGVCFNKRQDARGAPSWQAHITPSGKRIHLGYFWTLEEAAVAYANAAEKYFGEFAYPADSSPTFTSSLEGLQI
jgi:HNH endonuclease